MKVANQHSGAVTLYLLQGKHGAEPRTATIINQSSSLF